MAVEAEAAVESILTSNRPLVKESWIRMQWCYKEAVDPPPPIQGEHQADEGGEVRNIPPRPSAGQVRPSVGHPLTHRRLNSGGGQDCG